MHHHSWGRSGTRCTLPPWLGLRLTYPATYLHILCSKKPTGAHVGTWEFGGARDGTCCTLTSQAPQNRQPSEGSAPSAWARPVKPSIPVGTSRHGCSSGPCKGCLRTLAPPSWGKVSCSWGRAKGCSLSHIPLPPLPPCRGQSSG